MRITEKDGHIGSNMDQAKFMKGSRSIFASLRAAILNLTFTAMESTPHGRRSEQRREGKIDLHNIKLQKALANILERTCEFSLLFSA